MSILLTSCIPYKDTLYLEKNKDKVESINVNEDSNKPYRVQINDILYIKIKSVDQSLVQMFNKSQDNSSAINVNDQMLYFEGYLVDDFGKITIPILGELNVLNQTVDEIGKLIEQKLFQEYFHKDTPLFVTVKTAGVRYSINGEVQSPGTKVIFQDKVNVMEAIANAGDIREYGNKKEVMIIRKTNSGYQTEYLDLTDSKVINSPYFFIKPNDYIYVKPLKQKSLGLGANGLQTFTTVLSVFGVITTTYLLVKSL